MTSGLAPHLKFIAEGMIKGAMGLTDTMRGARDTAIALYHELDRQRGMAGDDEAGRAFAKVYRSAAAATLDKIGSSSYVLGEASRGLMRNAREFMAQESAVVAALLGRQADLTAGMGDPGEGCPENYLGLGRELPETVGETAWYEQYVPGGGSDRYRGSPEKLREVAGSWRRGGRLMLRFLEDAQASAMTADKAHSGEAADAFRAYFKMSVGLTCPPGQVQEEEPLVANLVAACNEIAKACDRYAEHVEAAESAIRQHKLDLFAMDMPWDSPMFGGNGFDGGLLDAVLGDPWIRRLGEVGHALDSAEKRVRLPEGGRGPSAPGLPFLPPLIPVPVPVPAPVPLVLASYTGGLPGIVPAVYRDPDPGIPLRDPIPPAAVPPPQLLTPEERKDFVSWVNGLKPAGFGGKPDATSPENAYQLRIAGYPERIIPLPADYEKPAIGADGMRPADGMMVDAKYVKDADDDCRKTTWRRQSTFEIADEYKEDGTKKWSKKDVLIGRDEGELEKYRQAMNEHDQIRGLEIVTNDKEAVPYWQTLMALQQVPGTARYVK
ncbi:restriction endonuclease fold toxin-2 domain-containing protein [Streptomyces sp. NPDC004041]|uniref:restriction endonuclease fold toxin-2 domain-containing protein n=1 Tax=Streptomyces sp. NPDC004041 TaxID=3364688 RepID=UPI003676C28D